jgi:hypothetical protein
MTKPPTREQGLEGVHIAAKKLLAAWNDEEQRTEAIEWMRLALKAFEVVEKAQSKHQGKKDRDSN